MDEPVKSEAWMRPGSPQVLAWTLAWGLTGIALSISGVFNYPRTGPLWVALLVGTLCWSVAGGMSFAPFKVAAQDRLSLIILLIWGLAFLIPFLLPGSPGSPMPQAGASAVFLIVLWAVGAAAAAFGSALLLGGRSGLMRAMILDAIWFASFLVGGFVGLMGLYLGPELGKLVIGSLIGQPAALTLGAGLGLALGGLAASAAVVALTRLVRV